MCQSSPIKVALVSLDAPGVPPWVVQQLERARVSLVHQECVSREQLANCAGDADVVWVMSSSPVVSAESLSDLKRCGAILRTGSGTDNIPVEEATRCGIVVVNTPQPTADPVSDHAIALLISIIRQIPAQDRAVRSGQWGRQHGSPDWHLGGSTLGLVGFGQIAQCVARKMSGFGVSILAYDPFVDAGAMRQMNVGKANLHVVLAQSDFVSIHVPLTKDTYHLIGERELRVMKRRSILINTSRGPVVDELVLIRALTEGWVSAAGLDVFENEPLPADHPLTKLPNVVLTPHIASCSDRLMDNFWRESVQALVDLSNGRWPSSCVNRGGVKPRRLLV